MIENLSFLNRQFDQLKALRSSKAFKEDCKLVRTQEMSPEDLLRKYEVMATLTVPVLHFAEFGEYGNSIINPMIFPTTTDEVDVRHLPKFRDMPMFADHPDGKDFIKLSKLGVLVITPGHSWTDFITAVNANKEYIEPFLNQLHVPDRVSKEFPAIIKAEVQMHSEQGLKPREIVFKLRESGIIVTVHRVYNIRSKLKQEGKL